VFAVIESGRGATVSGVAGVVAVLALAGLIVHEKGRYQPLLDLRFFRSVPFSAATIIAVCAFAAQGGFLFLNTLYLQEVRGLSAFHAGLCILPLAMAVMIISPLSGRVVGACGARPSLLVSGTLLSVSGLLLTRLHADTPLGVLLPVFALFGIGFGVVNAPITFTAVSGMPRAQAGLASAVASTSRQVGVSVGVAVAGALAGGAAGAHAHGGWSQFPEATHAFWWILAGAGVLILVLGWLSTSPWAKASTERIAHLLDEAPAHR
jgi:predicted MFS family arabinose efflux permease